IDYLKVSDSSGLKITGLTIAARPGVTGAAVMNSTNITMDHVDFHGQLDGQYLTDGSGVTVRDSHNVTVANSTFRELSGGVSHLGDDGLVISGNTFTAISKDGVMGTRSNNVTVTGNTFSDFHPAPGVHPDAIQFWTATTGPTHGITITNNVFVRGA